MSKCLGCGVLLQMENPDLDGYVEENDQLFCKRCFTIKNYGQNRVTNKTNVDYEKILSNIRDNDIVIYVSSLLTLNLDYIKKFKNVILVLTKRDVLPKSIKDGKIINNLKKKYKNVLDIIVVSAYKKYNLDNFYNKLLKYKDRDIYFVGITNSGKSSLINALIKSYNGYAGDITTSNYPSTTLDLIDVTIGDIKVKDTPGIVIEDSIINILDNNGIKKINSKKEIKPITFQIEGTGAILIDEFVRIEYETSKSSMTVYASNLLDISSISLNNPRLSDKFIYDFMMFDNQDLVIEDLGFIKFTKETRIKIYANEKIYMYIRDKLV